MELVKTQNIFGQQITVIAGDLIGRKILKGGAYDKTGLFFIDRLLRNLEKPICLDIGANIGNHAIVMSRHANLVLCFEPQRTVCEVLQTNVVDNGANNIRVFNFGLSNYSGAAKMAVTDAGNTGATTFVVTDAPVLSLDAELRHGDQQLGEAGVSHVDFIKVDVEGLEASVIDGLRETINSAKPIIMMEWNSDETRNGFRDMNLFSTCFEDYTFFSLRSTHERPVKTESKVQKIIRKISRKLFSPSIKLGDFSEQGEYGNIVGVPNHKIKLIKSIFP